MTITPIERPGVKVIQQFRTANPTILIPTQPACIMGPSYQVVEAVDDSGALVADAQISMPARLETFPWVLAATGTYAVGGDDLVLSANNRAAATVTFTGSASSARTSAQIVTDINSAAIPGVLALVETSGLNDRVVIYTTLSGDQASLAVDAATTAGVLTAFGFTAGYKARGWSGYTNYFHLDPQVADYPDPRLNLAELDIDYTTVRMFFNDGAGNIIEALRTESFLDGKTSAVAVVDDGDGDNLSPYLSLAEASFDGKAVLVSSVDWDGLTYPGDFGTFTFDISFDGAAATTTTFASPATVAAAIVALNAGISGAGVAYQLADGRVAIYSDTAGAAGSVEVLSTGTITEATLGFTTVALGSGAISFGGPSVAFAAGSADLTALTFATDIHNRVLAMSIDGGPMQQLSLPATIAAAADIITAINGLWGAGVAVLGAGNELELNSLSTDGGNESVIRIDQLASDATLLTNLGLTAANDPFASADAVHGTAYLPAVGDELWVDGLRIGEITEIPVVAPRIRVRVEAEQLLTYTGATWYIQAKELDNAAASATRPSSDLVVDEGSGTVTLKHSIFRESDGTITEAGPLSTYLAYTALRQDVSPIADDFTLLRYGTTTALTAAMAPIDTQNPLGFGMYFALLNAPSVEVTGLGVSDASTTEPDGTLAAYTEGFEFLESKDVYAIAPLTHDNTVGQIAAVHVDEMSSEENGLERLVILNPSRPTRKSNTLVASGALGNVSGPPTSTVQTGVANLQALLAGAGAAGPTYTIADEVFIQFEDDTNHYLIASVSGGVLTLSTGSFVSGNDDSFYYDAAGSPVFTSVIVDRPFTVAIRGAAIANLTEEATAYGEIAQGLFNRRVLATAPDQAKALVDGLETIIDGYYLNAALAGRISSKNPQDPLTEESLTGFTGLIGSNDRYGEIQLKIMSGGGLFVFYHDADGKPVQIRQQLTTDMSTIEKRELSILTAVDFSAKFIRTGLRNFIGRFNITTNVRDAVSITMDSLAAFLVQQGVLGGVEINAIRQSDTQPDELEIDATLTVLYPLNKIRVTLVV